MEILYLLCHRALNVHSNGLFRNQNTLRCRLLCYAVLPTVYCQQVFNFVAARQRHAKSRPNVLRYILLQRCRQAKRNSGTVPCLSVATLASIASHLAAKISLFLHRSWVFVLFRNRCKCWLRIFGLSLMVSNQHSIYHLLIADISGNFANKSKRGLLGQFMTPSEILNDDEWKVKQ